MLNSRWLLCLAFFKWNGATRRRRSPEGPGVVILELKRACGAGTLALAGQQEAARVLSSSVGPVGAYLTGASPIYRVVT